jgi:serine/threonine-protein kinase
MELEELKDLWNESNRKLEASSRLNTPLFAQWNLRKADTSLKRLARGITFELIVNLAGIFLLGWFAADHVHEPSFFIPAATLGVYAIALAAAGARQLFEVRSLDYDEPVVAIQDRLQRLRLARIRATMGTLLFAPLMWVPLLIVATRGFFGVNIYAVASPAWLAVNVLFGLAAIPIAVVIARALRPRLERATPIRFLADEIAGRSLAAAHDDLAAIRRFAEEG